MSAEGQSWLKRRVRVYAGWDRQKQYAPVAEGAVVGYAAAPTVVIRSDDGRQSHWQVTLPIDVLEENAEIPPAQRGLSLALDLQEDQPMDGETAPVTPPKSADICTCGASLNPDGSCQGLFAAAQADHAAMVEKLARWLHTEYGGPYCWEQTEEHIRENYRRTARDLLVQVPGMVLPGQL